MATYSETYQGCKIEIEDDRDLTIEGKHIIPQYDASTQKWSSQYLPYTTYSSLLDLAQAIVRDTEEFNTTQN